MLLAAVSMQRAEAVSAPPATAEPVTVSATISGKSVLFTVTNRGGRPVELLEGSLPWRTRYAATIAVIELSPEARALTQKFLPISDPGPMIVVLGPGGALSGTVDIEARYPGFSEAASRTELLVAWSCRLSLGSGRPLRRYSGAIAIEKR